MFNTEGCIQFYSWGDSKTWWWKTSGLSTPNQLINGCPSYLTIRNIKHKQNQDRYNQSILPTKKEI